METKTRNLCEPLAVLPPATLNSCVIFVLIFLLMFSAMGCLDPYEDLRGVWAWADSESGAAVQFDFQDSGDVTMSVFLDGELVRHQEAKYIASDVHIEIYDEEDRDNGKTFAWELDIDGRLHMTAEGEETMVFQRS